MTARLSDKRDVAANKLRQLCKCRDTSIHPPPDFHERTAGFGATRQSSSFLGKRGFTEPDLALDRARELERGNPNRATLAVARKLVGYMLASNAETRISCLPKSSVEQRQRKNHFSDNRKAKIGIHERAGCQVPPVDDRAKGQYSGGSLRIVSGLATSAVRRSLSAFRSIC